MGGKTRERDSEQLEAFASHEYFGSFFLGKTSSTPVVCGPALRHVLLRSEWIFRSGPNGFA